MEILTYIAFILFIGVILSIVALIQIGNVRKQQRHYLLKMAKKINKLQSDQDRLQAQVKQCLNVEPSLIKTMEPSPRDRSEPLQAGGSEVSNSNSQELDLGHAYQSEIIQLQASTIEKEKIKPTHQPDLVSNNQQKSIESEELDDAEENETTQKFEILTDIQGSREDIKQEELHQQKNTQQSKEKNLEDTPTHVEKHNKPEHKKANSNEAKTKAAVNQQQSSFDVDQFISKLIKLFIEHWMLWVGGFALALGGIFLVKYGLEQGMLSPAARVSIGGLFGCCLIAAALYLHKKNIVFEGFLNYTPAALAGGGVVTCFSLTLLAYTNYQLIPSMVATILLLLISAGSALLSLILGPVLAVIGFVGAYIIPLLINSTAPNLLVLCIYIGVVSIGAAYVAHKVKRQWLWYGIWGAHTFWLYAICFEVVGQVVSPWPGMLVILSIIGFVLIPKLSYRFDTIETKMMPLTRLLKPITPHILISIFSFPILVLSCDLGGIWLIYNIIVIAILLFAVTKNSQWDLWGAGALLFAVLAVVASMANHYIIWEFSLFPEGNFELSFGFIALFTLYGVLCGAKYPNRLIFHGIAGGSGFLFITLLYLFTPNPISFNTYLIWCFVLLFVSCLLIYRLTSADNQWQKFCYWLGVNSNITLALTLMLDGNSLTLALLFQVLSVAVLLKRIPVGLPDNIIKIFLAAILLRLSAAPWLPEYFDSKLFGIHWTIILYPLATAIFWQASKLFKTNQIQLWCQGAMLHTIALLVTTETSYQLLGRYPFVQDLGVDWKEVALLTMNWGILSFVYFYRMDKSGHLNKLYQYAGTILSIAAAVMFILNFTGNNPLYGYPVINVGSVPIFNWLIILWLIPAILCFYLEPYILQGQTNKASFLKWVSISLVFLFVNAANRQIWQGGNIELSRVTSDGELYSYSLLWMLIAVPTMILGFFKHNAKIQKVGLSLLIITVIKVFLIDMASLTGLLKAISFIGLGLSLVALSWLFQKLRQLTQEPKN